jgi:TolB-like protein
LFSLGAILYEAIEGRRAIPGSNEAEVLYSILNLDPSPPAGRSAAAGPLANLLPRLLSKEPASRPRSASVVSDALAANRGKAAPPMGRPAGRWVVVAMIAVSVALAILWSGGKRTIVRGDAPVAVVPFDNVSDPRDAARMGVITGNLVVSSLAQSRVSVLSTERVLEVLRDAQRPAGSTRLAILRQLGRQTGAGRVISGYILRTEPAIMLTAEVSDPESGRLLDADRVEGESGQTIFQTAEILGTRLAQRLPHLGHRDLRQIADSGSVYDLDAYRRFAEGLEFISLGDLNQAEGALREAVARAPRFREAREELAWVRWMKARPGEREAP